MYTTIFLFTQGHTIGILSSEILQGRNSAMAPSDHCPILPTPPHPHPQQEAESLSRGQIL